LFLGRLSPTNHARLIRMRDKFRISPSLPIRLTPAQSRPALASPQLKQAIRPNRPHHQNRPRPVRPLGAPAAEACKIPPLPVRLLLAARWLIRVVDYDTTAPEMVQNRVQLVP